MLRLACCQADGVGCRGIARKTRSAAEGLAGRRGRLQRDWQAKALMTGLPRGVQVSSSQGGLKRACALGAIACCRCLGSSIVVAPQNRRACHADWILLFLEALQPCQPVVSRITKPSYV